MFRPICAFLWLCFTVGAASVIPLTGSNASSILESSRLSFVNFFANWCPYSQALTPTIEEVGQKLKSEFPNSERLVIAKVDCEVEKELVKVHGVMKFPTMKLFRFGHPQRLEYRGQRTVEAIASFLRAQMVDSLVTLTAPVLQSALPLEAGEGGMVGRFDSNETAGFRVFSRAAEQLRDDCKFFAIFGPKAEPDSVAFVKGNESKVQVNLTSIDAASIRTAVQDHCVEIVRELTYENAEGITEEGKPMLVLFYRADDAEIAEKYKAVVAKHLRGYSDKVMFLYGQGPLFIRALRQMRKTVSDLPILALDSFRHMYHFPHDPRDSLERHPDRLTAFIEDLFSGKLHGAFHDAEGGGEAARATEPPASVFRRLSPSQSRYTLLREEL